MITKQASEPTLEMFYSFAPEDEAMHRELEKRLKLLERQHLITSWHSGLITPGANHQQETEQHLRSASLILFLLSPDYVDSDKCYAEMEAAVERYNAGEVLIVPILLRPVDFDALPVGSLQPLPTGGKAVTEWSSRDKAFQDIARGIRRTLEQERTEPSLSSPSKTRFWNIPYRRNLLFTQRRTCSSSCTRISHYTKPPL